MDCSKPTVTEVTLVKVSGPGNKTDMTLRKRLVGSGGINRDSCEMERPWGERVSVQYVYVYVKEQIDLKIGFESFYKTEDGPRIKDLQGPFPRLNRQ